MRSVGLDLGAHHIAFCEIADGQVAQRGSVRRFEQLKSLLGPEREPAKVGFEACREGWHVHDRLLEWNNEPVMLDTTRVRRIGVGDHLRKNDAIDAEAIARAIESGRYPKARVLSPARRELRSKLSVRSALVDTRAQYVTTVRALARAQGVSIGSCATSDFAKKVAGLELAEKLRSEIRPLMRLIAQLDEELAIVEHDLSKTASEDPAIVLCATVPGVALIVAATFVSVIDEASDFKCAQSVGAYLGLVPGESTTGGPTKRRLGSITKHGNTMARAMLVEAAWGILMRSPKDDPLRVWGEMIAKKRNKKIAAVAVARKLACVMWAMLRDGTTYNAASDLLTPPDAARGKSQSSVPPTLQNM